MLQEIFKLLQALNASLIVQWISTKSNIPADTLTRENLGDAFRLDRGVFDTLATAAGGLDIDRFATSHNNMLPRFNSYFWETGCAGVDAFAQEDWLRLRNYCNPSLSQIACLVKFI